jgi:membrane-associated protein
MEPGHAAYLSRCGKFQFDSTLPPHYGAIKERQDFCMNFIDLGKLIAEHGATVVYVILFAMIFAESGLFFGFFLPGDSLLLTAGLFAYKGVELAGGGELKLSLLVLIPMLFVAAVLGDNVGYWFGRRVGPPLFKRPQSLLFRPKNLLAAKAFYDKHGGKTITLARFMPFIRTFVPIVAGAVKMEWRRFTFFNLFGGLIWAAGVTFAGYSLGRLVPPSVLDRYFLVIVFVVIIVSMLPALIHLWKEERHEVFALIKTRILRRPAAEKRASEVKKDDQVK